jgi:hypothetical protein
MIEDRKYAVPYFGNLSFLALFKPKLRSYLEIFQRLQRRITRMNAYIAQLHANVIMSKKVQDLLGFWAPVRFGNASNLS